MKVLGTSKDAKTYICEVNHEEIEKFLDLYYNNMSKLNVGDEINLGEGRDWWQATLQALTKTEDFFKAHQNNIKAITKAFLTKAK
jgi:ribonucleotide reductase alpha subunit